RKSRAVPLSAEGGSACTGGTVTGCPSDDMRNSGRPLMLVTVASVTAPKLETTDVGGKVCRTELMVAMLIAGGDTKLTAPELSLPIQVTAIGRCTPCAATRRVRGPRCLPMRRMAALAACTGNAVSAIRATTVRATESPAVVVRTRP